MLIARLIADQQNLETRLDTASAALADAGTPIAAASLLDLGADVLQIALPHGDAIAVANVLEAHFGECDLLVSHGEIEVPRLFVSDMDFDHDRAGMH